MPAPESIRLAVEALVRSSGREFRLSSNPVTGTALYVVYSEGHPFRESYSPMEGVFGFRVPSNFPDACPEDSFFLQPSTVQLSAPDPVRNSTDINRTGVTPDFLTGTELGSQPVRVFSWHIWDRSPWDRRKHTLTDHYTHCLRRFEQAEHD